MNQESIWNWAVTQGPGMVFAVIMLACCALLIRWVLKDSSAREIRLVEVLRNQQDQIGKTVGDLNSLVMLGRTEAQQRYAGLERAAQFQREEHEGVMKTLSKLTESVQGFRCESRSGK